jgi:hypothetical protein
MKLLLFSTGTNLDLVGGTFLLEFLLLFLEGASELFVRIELLTAEAALLGVPLQASGSFCLIC